MVELCRPPVCYFSLATGLFLTLANSRLSGLKRLVNQEERNPLSKSHRVTMSGCSSWVGKVKRLKENTLDVIFQKKAIQLLKEQVTVSSKGATYNPMA